MGKISREQLGEWLSAYLDGEVNEEQRALIERLLREDDAARRQYEELRRTVELVGSLPRHGAPKSIAVDVQAFAERNELIGDPTSAGQGAGRKRSPLVPLLSMAATLAIVATGVWYVSDLAGTSTPKSQIVADATKPEGKGASPERSESLRSRRAAMPKAAPAIPETLLASATFDQKLRSGMGVEVVREHQFENEPVRLQVAVGNEVERDIVAARLLGRLKKQAAEDLTRSDSVSAVEPSAGRFYFEGSPEVNFAESGQRQVLVRASREELEELVEEMSRATTGEKEFALAAGPMSVRGFSRTQAMITGLEESTVTPDAGAFDAETDSFAGFAGGETGDDGAVVEGESSSLDGVLQIVGLDKAKFQYDFASAPKQEEAEVETVTNEPVALSRTEAVAAADRDRAAATESTGAAPPAEAYGSRAKKTVAKAAGQKKADESGGSPSDAVVLADMADENAKVGVFKNGEAPETLVSRRTRALANGRQKDGPAEPPAVGGRDDDADRMSDLRAAASEVRGAGDVASPSGGYVTLVIQVMVDKPTTSKPASRPARRTGKPTKDTPKQ